MKQNRISVLFAVGLLVFLFFPQWTKAEPNGRIPVENQMDAMEMSGLNVAFKLFGGFARPVGQNDVNKYLNGWNELLNMAGSFYQYNVSGEISPLGYSPFFKGELLFSFNPHFSIGLGAGYLQFSKQSLKTLSEEGYIDEFNLKPTISAIPLTLSLYYGLPIGDFLKIVVGVGAGYYFGHFKNSTTEASGGEEVTILFEANKNTFGAQGSLNIELNIGRTLALVFGISGRYAVLKDLLGTATFSYTTPDFSGSDTYSELTLWYLEDELFEGYYYASLFPSDEKPEESYYRNVRKAEIPLSSMALQIGILIRLSQLFQ